jgi:hypothetical protein
MRVLLQNAETKLYFAGPNEWTEDTAKAVDFEHVDRASQVYATENLAYAEIVLRPDLPGEKLQMVRGTGAEAHQSFQ